MNAVLDAVVADHGSIVVFTGLDADDGRRVVVAVDHRAAQDIIDAMADGPVVAYVESYQVLGRSVEPVA